jgi:hypothetical protein
MMWQTWLTKDKQHLPSNKNLTFLSFYFVKIKGFGAGSVGAVTWIGAGQITMVNGLGKRLDST